jgi:exopolyphosphatase/guanosine-5'-triphosphate,3'-diphosphate pyrophosphatase
MPIRLGDDAFTQKSISDSKVSQLVRTMIGFIHLIEAFQPLDFMACATSAMREAENGPQICERILEEADIKIDIIDGKREAQFIFENKSADMFGGNDAYLYVDKAASLPPRHLTSEPYDCWRAWYQRPIGKR